MAVVAVKAGLVVLVVVIWDLGTESNGSVEGLQVQVQAGLDYPDLCLDQETQLTADFVGCNLNNKLLAKSKLINCGHNDRLAD